MAAGEVAAADGPAPPVAARKDVTAMGTGSDPHGPAASSNPAGKGASTDKASSADVEAVGSAAWTEVVTGPAAV